MATYTVKSGDTLSLIAARILGDMARWRELANINKIANPNLIKVGQVLQLPVTQGTPAEIPPPTAAEEIFEITDPGTGKSELTVTAPRVPWGILAAIAFAAWWAMNRGHRG